MNVTVLVFCAECYEHDELVASMAVPAAELSAEGALSEAVLHKFLTYGMSKNRAFKSIRLLVQHDGLPVSEQRWFTEPSDTAALLEQPWFQRRLAAGECEVPKAEREIPLGLGQSMWLRYELPIDAPRLSL